jgi:hypothetical protein
MKCFLLTALLILGALPIAFSTVPAAACSSGSGGETTATTSGNSFVIGGSTAVSENCTTSVGDHTTPGEWHSEPMCELGGSATCESFATCSDGSVEQYVYFVADDGQVSNGQTVCPSDDVTPVVTAEAVLNALRRVALPPSDLIVQPPNGRTLVNFDTNFYTEAAPLDRTIRLLGQRVDLRIWPSSYEWHFGDGEAIATESAGAPYPDLEITHSYTTKGQVGPAVDTTYAAEFRVNAGPWRPVPGTVTIPGDTVALEVVEATPTLVGYR